jgi:uncharacterized protein YlxW (UPF0749 family)
MENSCRKKHKPSPKKWILASRCTGFRRNSALIPANAGLFHYAGNNPVRYIDPDGKSDADFYSIQELNEIARYRSNLQIYKSYLSETLKIMKEIGSLQQQVGVLKNEIFDLKVAYKKQSLNDFLNIINLCWESASTAAMESNDTHMFFCNFLSSLDPQTCAETLSDYLNEDRITKADIIDLEIKNKKEIRKLELKIKELQAALKNYEDEISKLKNEMDGIGE